MDILREYGILTNNETKELFETINSRPYCDKCRMSRKQYENDDKKKGEDGEKHLGIIIPGFSSKKANPLDIMIIADSIGGGRKGDFRQESNIPIEKAVRYLGNYYLEETIARFYQYEMRKFLRWLDEDLKKNWIFTDLVKCFVFQGIDRKSKVNCKDNMKLAIKHCSQYLNEQVEKLKPGIIMILGKQVAEDYCKYDAKMLKLLTHGNLYKYDGFNVVYSVFPSMRTADLWVKDIEKNNGDAWLPVKNTLRHHFNNNK